MNNRCTSGSDRSDELQDGTFIVMRSTADLLITTLSRTSLIYVLVMDLAGDALQNAEQL